MRQRVKLASGRVAENAAGAALLQGFTWEEVGMMSCTKAPWRMVAVPLCVLAMALCAADASARRLPQDAADTIAKSFPNAKIQKVARERENGVMYYEVNLLYEGNRIEVEVDEYGVIGEVERKIDLSEAPKPLQEAVRKLTGSGGRARIERHERWGRAVDGRFVALEHPRVFYEVKLTANGRSKSATWRPEQFVQLPAAVNATVTQAYPLAVTVGADEKDLGGVKCYECILIMKGLDMRVTVSADGALMAVAREIPVKRIPAAVAKAVRQASAGARVTRLEKLEIKAEARAGAVAALNPEQTAYRFRLRKADKVADLVAAPDGRVTQPPVWRQSDDEEDDEDDEDDDD